MFVPSILLGLIHEGEGVAKALESLGVSLERVREKVEETVGPAGSSTTGSPPFTPRAKKVIELSLREALQLGHNYIGTEHMLLGVVREGKGIAAQVLVSLGADLATVRQRVIDLLAGYQPPQPGAGGVSFTEHRAAPAARRAGGCWRTTSATGCSRCRPSPRAEGPRPSMSFSSTAWAAGWS